MTVTKILQQIKPLSYDDPRELLIHLEISSQRLRHLPEFCSLSKEIGEVIDTQAYDIQPGDEQ